MSGAACTLSVIVRTVLVGLQLLGAGFLALGSTGCGTREPFVVATIEDPLELAREATTLAVGLGDGSTKTATLGSASFPATIAIQVGAPGQYLIVVSALGNDNVVLARGRALLTLRSDRTSTGVIVLAKACELAADCGDGVYCNGIESCESGLCVDGPAPPIDDGNPCTVDECTERFGVTNLPNTDLEGRGCVAPTEPSGFGVCTDGTCATSRCGDGFVVPQTGEECDDAGSLSGDGCSADCRIERGWSCSGVPSRCATICGDGIATGNEGCDDGGTTNGNGCSETCQVEQGYACAGEPSLCETGCGDGVRAGIEECDDANSNDCDGCDAACRGHASYTCGDGFVCPGESCDEGSANSSAPCDDCCRPSSCQRQRCGDGVVDPGEECDDGNNVEFDGCDACLAGDLQVAGGTGACGFVGAIDSTGGAFVGLRCSECNDGCSYESGTVTPTGSIGDFDGALGAVTFDAAGNSVCIEERVGLALQARRLDATPRVIAGPISIGELSNGAFNPSALLLDSGIAVVVTLTVDASGIAGTYQSFSGPGFAPILASPTEVENLTFVGAPLDDTFFVFYRSGDSVFAQKVDATTQGFIGAPLRLTYRVFGRQRARRDASGGLRLATTSDSGESFIEAFDSNGVPLFLEPVAIGTAAGIAALDVRPNGAMAVAWYEPIDSSRSNLFVQRLESDASPAGQPALLTRRSIANADIGDTFIRWLDDGSIAGLWLFANHTVIKSVVDENDQWVVP